MAEMIARFKPGQNVPGFCTADVRAGRFVKIVDGKTVDGDYSIAECGAGQKTFGVAERDGVGPSETQRSSWTRRINIVRPGAIARVVAGAAVSAPAEVQSDSQGRAITVAAEVEASLDTGVVGSNNAITWTSKKKGTPGNASTVTLVDPGGETAALSVDVDGEDIIVSLARTTGALSSKASAVIAAVLEHDTASQLVTTVNKSTSTGAGIVAAVAKTNLAGGIDASTDGIKAGQAVSDAAEAGDIIEIALY